ncbi:MAG: HAMP domain-containing sensor histidine kinase [Rhizobiaceae bacterium]
MIRSLRLRLLFAAAILILFALGAVWLILVDLFERDVAAGYERELIAVIDTLAANLDVSGQQPSLTQEPSDPRYSIPASGHYWQLDDGKGNLLRSRSLWDQELEPRIGRAVANSSLLWALGPDGQALIAERQEITFGDPGSEKIFIVTAAMAREGFDLARDEFSRSLAIMLAITGAALVLASALQVYLGLIPLDQLRKDVNAVRSGVKPRMPESGPGETRLLVNEINELLDLRDDAIERARNRASDLAHGLKTPLTVLSHVADKLADGNQATSSGEMHEQIGIIRQRIDRQLALARMGAVRKSSTPVREATERLVAIMRRLTQASAITWEEDCQAGTAMCDQTDFSEALGNVLDNARKYTRRRVAVTAREADGHIRISVEDDGPGVPVEKRQAVLARGVGLEDTASETGLGLAIAHEILSAHGGALELAQSSLGGLKVVLVWPAA